MTVQVYVASKSKHGAMWLACREAWRWLGIEVVSTWIDEWEPGASPDMTDLWSRCVDEAANCHLLICYVGADDHLKGALVEIGAALASGTPVYVCNDLHPELGVSQRLGSWISHELVTLCASPDDALKDFCAFHLGGRWPGELGDYESPVGRPS